MLPVLLNLQGKRAVVFGGGPVAERRAVKLLQAGARVTVVSREFTPGLEGLKSPRLELVEREVQDGAGFIEISDVVLVATNDKDLNASLEKEARKQKKLVNRADAVSDFVIPAALEVGGIVIAVSSGGRSPGVARMIKKRLERAITQEDVLAMELQERLRARLRGEIADQKERRRRLREALQNPEVLEALRARDLERAERIALEGICTP